MKRILTLLVILSMGIISCNRAVKTTDQNSEAPEEKTSYQLVEVWQTDTTLLTPECALYDDMRNVIYVSNLNLEPRMKDGNGFISKLSPDGEILELNWIGEMSSPKGMALVDNKLYVTDVDELIEMDVDQGEITGRWIVDGAGMLNDIAADKEGKLYFSDSDGNTIYTFKDGTYEMWLNEGLEGPNGLFVEKERLLLASFGSADFKAIDYQTKEISMIAEGINRGDGVEAVGEPGNYIVSDWEGQVFYIYPDGSKEVLLTLEGDQEQTADVGFIKKKGILLVPTFFGNQVIAFKLEKK